ncbi:hypothetical protein EHQ05_16540 [Leptospira yasudae]|uniref:Amidohydrolase-related domain-containing protein n=1 Tax=Leptospira yasudae TaxID=2202201 RepID=A0ABX9LZ94_9LEPT|nr:amidohydrolase family protein [Leptospira yasudae]RHX78266.1 hypothetical protein DLM77_17685 [Leptospira yasudae]TGK24521.1 hypothetical protein EHQ05_16540 [Leptospira yasudae]TGM05693.1 hypothetical protein EHQ86_09685 [Leptospira yasudae]
MIIDMFIHPILKPSEADLFNIDPNSVSKVSDHLAGAFQKNEISHGVICFFDIKFLKSRPHLDAFRKSRNDLLYSYSYLIDFRSDDWLETLTFAAKEGFKSITFHSYLQEIKESEYDNVRTVCIEAEKLGLYINVCSAFGSKKIYKYYSLPLAVHILDAVSCPVLLVHAGGGKLIEALLIAEMYPNAYLETSFSVTFWKNSSVEIDLAYGIRKFGADRFMFGSDFPFVSLEIAIADHNIFFEKFAFGKNEIEQIMYGTSRKILNLK